MPYGEGRDGTLKSTSNRTTTDVSGNGILASKLTGSESEENILPIQKTGDGIIKRTDIVMSYGEQDKNDLERGGA
jgi:hypothetical protein